MAASINSSPVHRVPDLLGQTVLVMGGSSGIGLETARLARPTTVIFPRAQIRTRCSGS